MPCASGTVLTQPDWKTSMFFSLLKSDVNPTLRNASEGIRTACDSQLPGARFARDGELASFARQFPLESFHLPLWTRTRRVAPTAVCPRHSVPGYKTIKASSHKIGNPAAVRTV